MHYDHTTPAASTVVRDVFAGVASALATVALIFVLGRAVDTATQHAALLLGTLGIVVLLVWWTLEHMPSLRMWIVGGIVLAMVVSLAVGGLRSRPTMVDEQVVMAGAVEPSGDAMMAKDPKGGDAMMAKGDAPKGDAMMAKDPKGGDAMMAKDDAPKGDAMMAKDAPKGDAMMAKDEAAATTGGGDVMVKEEAPAQNVLVASGSFQPLEHKGSGTASIIRTTDGRNVLTLTGGFETDAGPDLVVYLVKGNPKNDSDVENGEHISLGTLKGTSGDQQYVLPKDVDPAEFTHAYVWCRAFSVGFTRAKLA